MNSKIQPIDTEQLSKYFDPVIYDSLQLLSIKGIEWQRLTIVFWDISGFSKVCKKVKDNREAIEPFLTEYFKMASNLISQHSGVLDKFMGDGILAYFGFPIDDDETPSKAVEAALELRNKFRRIKETYEKLWQRRYGEILSVDLRCGIHTGSVYFGQIPAGNRNQIAVFGTEVNLASRLEKVAKKDEIIVSEQVKNMIYDNFLFETKSLPEPIKDFDEIKEVYLVLEKKDPNLKGQKTDITNFAAARVLSLSELNSGKHMFHFDLSQKYSKSFRFAEISVSRIKERVYDIQIKAEGTISKGFFDIMTIKSNGEKDWNASNLTFDANTYSGKLNLRDEIFNINLILDLSNYSDSQVRPFVLVFEDSDGNSSGKRKLVSGFEIVGLS
ncbi:MAG: adenylate/guanylate cyclase domain-containing protein [Candidatus Nitrosocosmicus sp.]|nr:adenylate/guanylate cyclase domain-containing protein [Candidatus Nitrosocosmicus sp.]MDN5867049.1 adenylate/guanylate cyclase domain-containing protein [Candidatus Nitrosocosmicus sp.]